MVTFPTAICQSTSAQLRQKYFGPSLQMTKSHKLKQAAWGKLLLVLRSVTPAWESKILVSGRTPPPLSFDDWLKLAPAFQGVVCTLRED